ncbi:hypothetical protein C8Q70DRAFT_269816 [Cubamyces menziesii]|nr:hypothetical protein C8Q70DRAFT_269816 [Cubamyces menziesii]
MRRGITRTAFESISVLWLVLPSSLVMYNARNLRVHASTSQYYTNSTDNTMHRAATALDPVPYYIPCMLITTRPNCATRTTIHQPPIPSNVNARFNRTAHALEQEKTISRP